MTMSEDDQASNKPSQERSALREWLLLVLTIGALFFGVRWFVFEPFRIPSESMLPTLEVGDMVVVSKMSYGYGDFSLDMDLPFLPDDRILGGDPQPGDIAVFRHPKFKRNLIKRIIGVPGDTVQMVNGQLFLNGEPMPQKLVGAATNTSLSNKPAQLLDEHLWIGKAKRWPSTKFSTSPIRSLTTRHGLLSRKTTTSSWVTIEIILAIAVRTGIWAWCTSAF